MSNDNSDTPLDFPSSEAEYYPEHVENSVRRKKTPIDWAPEIIQMITEAGYSPDDLEISSEEDIGSELEEEENFNEEAEESEEPATNQPVQALRAGNFKIKLLAPKPPVQAGTASQPAAAEKPSRRGHLDVSVDNKKLPAPADALVKSKKRRADSEAETEHSGTSIKEKATKTKKRSKKKARADEAEQKVVSEDVELAQSPALKTPKKRGRPHKLIDEKVSRPVGSQPFNTSVFVSIENPPQLMRGRTHKTDKHIAQEPRVEGPFTLIRSMKWEGFLDEVAGWVGVDKENLRVNGLSWGFQKQKAHLPLTSKQAFNTLREQVKVKNGSATVIFVYHPICKQPQSRGHNGMGQAIQLDDTLADESRWGKKLSLDDKLAPIITQLETLYAVGQCSEHPDIHCFFTSVRPNETWHFELNKARFAVWANAINRKEVDYERAPIGRNFFGAKDRIQSLAKNSKMPLQVVPQTPPPPPPHLGGDLFAPPAHHALSPAHHAYAWPPFYQHSAHASPGLMSPNPGFHFPQSPYYPSSIPFGYGTPTPWGYPAAPPQTPGPKNIPVMTHAPQIPPAPGPAPQIPASTASFPVTQDLKAWCVQHVLGEAEYEGLSKLGFRVGDSHDLADLETSMWEWAGIAPLARMRILAACKAAISSSSS